jgi:ubiquinone/menaquinone biosynthesis C-methylase UbiE
MKRKEFYLTMTNKTSQKDYFDSFEDFDAIELGVVDGRENEYRKEFISRRAEKMAKIADLDDESTILEVGCGTGIYSTHWVKSPIKFYGLDISRGMLRRAATKIDSDKTLFVEADAEHLPFRDASFDVVLSVNTIEHLGDIPMALKEMKRVCRDGGEIVLSVLNGNFSAKYRRKLMQVLKRVIARIFKERDIPKPAKTHGDDFTHQDLTMEDFTRLFAEAGIRVERKIFMGFVPHQIIPAGVARYFMFMEVLEKVLERIPWIRTWGGSIIICGVNVKVEP